MEPVITHPNLSGVNSTDIIVFIRFINTLDLCFRNYRISTRVCRQDLELFLMEIDKHGRKFAKDYKRIHFFNIERANKFRNGMKNILKYCIQIAAILLDKLEHKSAPENEPIQVAYNQLIRPEIPLDATMMEKHRVLILRIVQMLAYWYAPQGVAMSDAESGDES